MAGGNGVNRAMETLRKYQKEMLEIRMMKPRPDKAEGRGRETPKLLCREKRVGGGQPTKVTPVWQEKQRRRERQGAKGTTEALTAEKLPKEGRT